MDVGETVSEGDRCHGCGEKFRTDARFCKHCGASRLAPSEHASAARDLASPPERPVSQPGPSTPPTGGAAQPPGYQAPSVGGSAQPPGYQAPSVGGSVQPPGYQAPLAGSPVQPPGYPTPHAGATVQQPGYEAPPAGMQPPGYPTPPVGATVQPPGYPTPPGGYPTPPGHPVQQGGYQAPPAGYQATLPGYVSAASGYPLQPVQPAAPPEAPRDVRRTGWLIGGVAAAVLATVGIGTGIYLAVSGGDGQTRLLATPVVSVASATAKQASSTGQPTANTHTASSHESLPPSVSAPAVAASARPTIGQSSETRAVADTIQRHFSLISEHNFSAAYALLAPSLQSGESSWVASHREDGIYKVNVAVDAKLASADSATATIVKMTTLDGHGCKNWSGDWGLTKIGGQWRISESNISSTPC
jgi:hypothetical protein